MQANPAALPRSDRAFIWFATAFSSVAVCVLAYLLLRRHPGARVDLSFLPAINAGLNGSAAVLLLAAYVAIQSGNRVAHGYLMVTAFAASTLFLVGYVAYHSVHGDTHYLGSGALRVAYLSILASHVLLSMVLLPLVLTTFYFALRRNFARHRPLAKITLPIWLYVSVTGVVIFFMLRSSGSA